MNVIVLFIYFGFFVISGISYIFVNSVKNGQIDFGSTFVAQAPSLLTSVLKVIPTSLAIFFVLFTIVSEGIPITIFTIGLTMALLLCAIGDALIIKKLLYGLIAFLIAHIFFITAYANKIAETFPLNSNLMVIALGLFFIILLVDVSFYIYLKRNANTAFEKMKYPIIIYMSFISLNVLSAGALTLLLIESNLFSLIVLVSSLLFFLSDSIIALREFHRDFPLKHSIFVIMSTYYTAIFLISLIPLIVM